MEVLLLLLLFPASVLLERAVDPSPGIGHSKAQGRTLECARMSQAEAHERYPGRVPAPPARGPLGTADALVCAQRLVAPGERPDRDEAVLQSLSGTVGVLAQAAVSRAGLTGVTWHVDAHYPDPRVAGKIVAAAKTSLAEGGQRVSERLPMLAAGDLAVIGQLPPSEAFPLACRRYFDLGSLKQDQALLGIVLLDVRETQLHAGVCARGEWQWLE